MGKYCYDSLEDFLVTHPDNEISNRAVDIVSLAKDNTDMWVELKKIKESSKYFSYHRNKPDYNRSLSYVEFNSDKPKFEQGVY